MTFRGTGMSVSAGTANPGELYTEDGQSNDGTGGSTPDQFPAGIPTGGNQQRMKAFYKNGLWRVAQENVLRFGTAPETLVDPFQLYLPVLFSTSGISPYIFFANRLLESPKLDGKEVLLQCNAIGGTFSMEWAVTAIDPPGAFPYSASVRACSNARRRPNTTYRGKFVGQCESNSNPGLTNENTFTAANWVKVAVTAAINQATDPDGTVTANRLTETVANSAHSATSDFNVATPQIGGTAVPLVGTTVTYKVRLKTGTLAAPRNWGYIEGNGGASRCWFNTNTGAVGTQTACTGTITSLGSGWFACEMTFVFASGGMGVGLATGDGVTSYAGSVTSDLLVWSTTTNALAVRWFNDWDAHRTAWRIQVGIPNLPFFVWQISTTIPGPTAGRFYENWNFLRNTVQPLILADPFTFMAQRTSGPFIDSPDNLHLAPGPTDTQGQWGSGIAMGDVVLAANYP